MVEIKEGKKIKQNDLTDTYYEIQRLENKKKKYIELYCIRHNITASELKDVIVSGGTRLADAMLNKVIKTDEYLQEIEQIKKEIACLSEYLNKEIATMLLKGDDTPAIIFLRDFKDVEKKRNLTFQEIADKIYSTERTVKRKYYDYKNSIN